MPGDGADGITRSDFLGRSSGAIASMAARNDIAKFAGQAATSSDQAIINGLFNRWSALNPLQHDAVLEDAEGALDVKIHSPQFVEMVANGALRQDLLGFIAPEKGRLLALLGQRARITTYTATTIKKGLQYFIGGEHPRMSVEDMIAMADRHPGMRALEEANIYDLDYEISWIRGDDLSNKGISNLVRNEVRTALRDIFSADGVKFNERELGFLRNLGVDPTEVVSEYSGWSVHAEGFNFESVLAEAPEMSASTAARRSPAGPPLPQQQRASQQTEEEAIIHTEDTPFSPGAQMNRATRTGGKYGPLIFAGGTFLAWALAGTGDQKLADDPTLAALIIAYRKGYLGADANTADYNANILRGDINKITTDQEMHDAGREQEDLSKLHDDIQRYVKGVNWDKLIWHPDADVAKAQPQLPRILNTAVHTDPHAHW